jgi:hypothetical protein
MKIGWRTGFNSIGTETYAKGHLLHTILYSQKLHLATWIASGYGYILPACLMRVGSVLRVSALLRQKHYRELAFSIVV